VRANNWRTEGSQVTVSRGGGGRRGDDCQCFLTSDLIGARPPADKSTGASKKEQPHGVTSSDKRLGGLQKRVVVMRTRWALAQGEGNARNQDRN